MRSPQYLKKKKDYISCDVIQPELGITRLDSGSIIWFEFPDDVPIHSLVPTQTLCWNSGWGQDRGLPGGVYSAANKVDTLEMKSENHQANQDQTRV